MVECLPMEALGIDGENGRRLDGAKQGTSGCTGSKHRKERTEGHASTLHRAFPGNYADILGIDAEGKAEPATVGAPRLCRAAAGRYAAPQPCQRGDRLHARIRRHNAWSGCQRSAAAAA